MWQKQKKEGRPMALFVLVPALVLLCVVLLAPLMLPGAIVVLVIFGVAELARRHHASRAAQLH
jgi:hypothetical protein